MSGNPTLGTYWRDPQGFGRFVGLGDSYAGLRVGQALTLGGDQYHANLSLLAYAVGDRRERPLGPRGPRPVPAARYEVEPGEVVHLGPFATVGPGAGIDPVGLPIASKLRAFLDDPLKTGRPLDLGLPFFDEDVVLGPDSGWLRDTDTIAVTVHSGIDFSTRPRRLFEVAAAQAGTVVALIYGSAASQRGLVIEHPSGGESPFRTIYQHMDEETVTLAVGDRVAKGQALGQIVAQIRPSGNISHLHFGVAVCGPEFSYDGVDRPKLWFLIDPFGVYDYRTDDTTYVPRTAEGMWLPIRGAERRVQWSSIVPAEALPVERLTDS